MKYLSLLFLAFTLPAMAQTHEITFTWTNGNTGTSALPACTSTVTTSCVSGFTLTMDSATVVAGPTAIGPALATYTQTPAPAIGTHAYSLVMNGFDGLGNAITSSAATTSVVVPAPVTINPPTGFKAVIQ